MELFSAGKGFPDVIYGFSHTDGAGDEEGELMFSALFH